MFNSEWARNIAKGRLLNRSGEEEQAGGKGEEIETRIAEWHQNHPERASELWPSVGEEKSKLPQKEGAVIHFWRE